MPYYCDPCERSFNTINGYNMHIENSAAHQYRSQEFECDACDRTFLSEHSLHQHCSTAAGHPYCVSCKRMFMNRNNLNQHLHSKIHLGSDIQCPFCKTGFATASGVTIHLESGTCPKSDLDRHKLNDLIRRLDKNHIITKPLLTYHDTSASSFLATDRAWNGYAFQCYLCPRQFASLRALDGHMKSPAHDQKVYRCPGPRCGREYKLLSGLIQHVESEACGVMRFRTVQQQAKNGIQNMVGRMINA